MAQLPVNFEGVTPIFNVRDLEASIKYYVDVLGFKVEWQGGGVASVSRDGCGVFLAEGDQGHPGAWLWAGVSDAGALFAEYQTSGAKIRHPPTNFQWAYEMQVEDLDGNVLRLGSEPKENQPFGPWKDMRGDLWMPRAEGGWRRVE